VVKGFKKVSQKSGGMKAEVEGETLQDKRVKLRKITFPDQGERLERNGSWLRELRAGNGGERIWGSSGVRERGNSIKKDTGGRRQTTGTGSLGDISQGIMPSHSKKGMHKTQRTVIERRFGGHADNDKRLLLLKLTSKTTERKKRGSAALIGKLGKGGSKRRSEERKETVKGNGLQFHSGAKENNRREIAVAVFRAREN